MADIYDVSKRSEIMSKVKAKGNKSTEIRLIKVFNSLGISGWRRNYNVKGHPDFVFIKQRIAVFVDGCFWHGHNCRNTTPADNADFWKKKQERNQLHDEEINRLFEGRGWTVIRIWECELTKKKKGILHEKLKPLIDIAEHS